MKEHVDRRRLPPFPWTTGIAAEVLGTTEPRLSETVRRGHVSPPPPIFAGRRLWTPDLLIQAARTLDVDPVVLRLLGAEPAFSDNDDADPEASR